MKLKKLLTSFLAINLAFSPFVSNITTELNAFVPSSITKLASDSTSAAQEAFKSTVNASLNAGTEVTKTFGQWATQQASGLKSATVGALFAIEALGVRGLSKLTIDPSKIYLFFRNHPQWIFVSVIGALGSYIYLKSWNDTQKSLITGILYNLQYEIDHIKTIHAFLRAKQQPSSYAPAKKSDTEAKAAKINNTIPRLINEFYREVERVLHQAKNSRVAEDLQPLQKIQAKIHAHFVSPLPL